MHLPPPLHNAIEQETSRYSLKQLKEAAAELSEKYRHGKTANTRHISNDTLHTAYLAVRMPATFAAASAVLSEIRRLVPERNISSLLDLGAGAGAVAWAATDLFEEIEQITHIEQDLALIRLGKSMAEKSANQALRSAEWRGVNLMTTTEFPAHDLVICSYSLGETGRENALRILRTAWHSTRQTIAIIEPGTMKGFDLIRTLREELIQLGGHIIAPCPHQKDCPMGGGDWCHFSARFERSSLHRQIKSGSLGYEDEKFAYIAASKQPICRPGARIIRHPEIHAGFIRLQLCAKDQLHTYTATRSDKAAWKRARKIGWGDAWE